MSEYSSDEVESKVTQTSADNDKPKDDNAVAIVGSVFLCAICGIALFGALKGKGRGR